MNIVGCNIEPTFLGLTSRYRDPILYYILGSCNRSRLNIRTNAYITATKLKTTIVAIADVVEPLESFVSARTVAEAIYIFKVLCIVNLISALKKTFLIIFVTISLTFAYFLSKNLNKSKMSMIKTRTTPMNIIIPLLSRRSLDPKRDADGSSKSSPSLSESSDMSDYKALSLLL